MEELDEFQSGCEAGQVYRPLLSYLHAKKTGQPVPPYVPEWKVLPLQSLAKLALLWNEAGFFQEAGELANFCLKLEPFFSLWCPERQYCENKKESLLSRLKQIPLIQGPNGLDLTLFESPKIKASLTTSGAGTGLGVVIANGVEIRAFGPQSSDLQFGIQGEGMDQWTRTFCFPEVWVNMIPEFTEEKLAVHLRFAGLRPQNPLFMAFYVRAKNCRIGSEILFPKTLDRFNQEAQTLFFEERFCLKSREPLKTQVIPLAGSGCFWDCQFLVLFEINPFCSQMVFSFTI